MRVGWLGLGAMGAPMAACVAAAGHEVRGYDIAPGRTVPGVTVVESAAEAVGGAEAVAVMVATPSQVDAVLDAAGDLPSGAVVLLMATVGPVPVRGWAERLSARGVDLVDAPVSGGVARARAGDLLIMASGAAEPVGRVRPLLDAMARQAPVVGAAPGDGQRVKLVNQLLCGVHIAVAGEAIAFAERLGLDPRACWEVVRHGAAASFMLDDRGERMLDGAFDDVRSALDIFVKDMGLVLDAARDSGFTTPLAAAAAAIYAAGAEAGLGRRDDSVVIEVARGRVS